MRFCCFGVANPGPDFGNMGPRLAQNSVVDPKNNELSTKLVLSQLLTNKTYKANVFFEFCCGFLGSIIWLLQHNKKTVFFWAKNNVVVILVFGVYNSCTADSHAPPDYKTNYITKTPGNYFWLCNVIRYITKIPRN